MRAWRDGVEVSLFRTSSGLVLPTAGTSPEWGRGVFETLRAQRGRAFAVSRHLRRMRVSAAAVGLPVVEVDLVRGVVEEVAAELGEPSRLRLTWSQGPDVDPEGPGGGLLCVTTSVLPDPGVDVSMLTVPWRRNAGGAVVRHKSTSYAESMVAAAYARRHGADEGVLLTEDGRVSEGAACNVFVVVDGALCTPSLASGCLPGITRELVTEWFDVRELGVTYEEALTAQEVFVTSATRGPVPVRSWDGRRWETPGPVTREVAARWAYEVAKERDR